jgi:hypothetical protein
LPGVAETLDWAQALMHLHAEQLDAMVVNATLGIILKYQDDVDKMQHGGVDRLLEYVTLD